MPGASRWVWAGLLVFIVGLAGCGKDPFGPPEREVSTENEEPEEPSKTVFIIAPRPADVEIAEIVQQAQSEMNQRHTISRIMEPPSNDPTMDQAELIKMAVKDSASGLILIPGESPGLGKILAEAESKGVPVVVIGRPIPAPEGSKPFTFIDFAPVADFASKIVAGTLGELKKVNRPAEGTVLVLVDQVTDRTSADRVAALMGATASAGFSKVVQVPIRGDKPDQAIEQVKEALKANPDTIIILADDGETMFAAAKSAQERKGQPALAIGGFVDFTLLKPKIPWEFVCCYCQGGYERMGKLAAETILSRLSGKTVPDRVLLTPLFKVLKPEERQPSLIYKIVDPNVPSPQPSGAKP